MKIINSIVLLFVVMALLGSCSQTPVVATVDNKKITLADFNTYCRKKAGMLGVADLSRDEKKKVLNAMIRREIVSLYGVKTGITATKHEIDRAAQDPVNRGMRKQELEKLVIFDKTKKNIEGAVTARSAEIERYYSSNKAEFRVPEMYRVHIVEVKEFDAKHVMMQLRKKPEAFDDMALKTSAPELVDLNKKAVLTPKDWFPDEMAGLLRKMKINEIAGPVKTKRGAFLFKLLERKKAGVKPLVDVYAEIAHMLSAEKKEEVFDKWYDSIKGNYSIKIKIAELQDR